MSEIPDLITAHPWWIVATVAIAVTVATWIVAGGALLERRYGDHMLGRSG
jgi:hypothetical protein